MARLHRSLKSIFKKIDPNRVANAADDFIEGARIHRSLLKGVRGLFSVERLKALVKKVDVCDREIEKLENKIDKLLEKKALEAIKLQEMLDENFDILQNYLEPDELGDFF